MTRCDRCGEETGITTGSMFNMQTICMVCKDIEREHPKYEEAARIEMEAVIDGNYNFPGIGLPSDLRRS